jgi:hypothetical protein
MFERVMELYGETSGIDGRVSRMLKIQYRMNEKIANWASQALYNHALQTHDSVKHHTLAQLDGCIVPTGIDHDGIAHVPLLLLDTAGCAMYESTNAAGSRYNLGEVQLVMNHVRTLLGMGIAAEQIAVITPYNGQVEILRSTLLPEIAPTLQIRSVDGFQGGEREAVILSLVRSSHRGGIDGIGFLRDDRRLNVAITRAKRHCCVICDSETVSQSPLVKNLLEWIETFGEQRSAMEVQSTLDTEQNVKDQAQAELVLQQLIENRDLQPYNKVLATRKQSPKIDSTFNADLRRQALFDQIRIFQSKSNPGDELLLDNQLSKADRKLVHEIAEDFGLHHCSEGVEGINRRIKITLPQVTAPMASAAPVVQSSSDTQDVPTLLFSEIDMFPEAATCNMKAAVKPIIPPPILALKLDDDNQIISNGVDKDDAINTVLRSLTIERVDREKQQQELSTNTSRQMKKSKGRKLGSDLQQPSAMQSKMIARDGSVDLDDDMAFLDAQIDAVQNSHGRRVEGPGKGYRTIINGILLSQPKQTATKNTKAAAVALNAKLRTAKDSRKVQVKKK